MNNHLILIILRLKVPSHPHTIQIDHDLSLKLQGPSHFHLPKMLMPFMPRGGDGHPSTGKRQVGLLFYMNNQIEYVW